MNRIISSNKRSLALAGMITAALAFTACSQRVGENEQEQSTHTPAEAYPTAPVKNLNPEYELSLPAELEPYEQVAVYAKVTGFVKQLYAERGDRVRKGQLLAVLEAPEMEQQYLSDKSTEQKIYSDYLYAKQAYDRLAEASATTGAVAANELDPAKGAIESAQPAYEPSMAGTAQASHLQRYLRVTAPFDGVITDRNISVGALAGTQSGKPLFLMAQDNRLRLTLSLPEKHAAAASQNTRAVFTVSSQPGKSFEAVLSRSSNLLDEQDRSLTLEFDIDNVSGELHGGDYAQAKVTLQRKNPTYWVPGSSVLSTQSGTFVMTVTDQGIKRLPVKAGLRMDTLTEVFGDLSPEDRVILKPSEEITANLAE